MASNVTNTDFTVWGADQAAYGPVELPTLVSWVRGERVTADTWIFDAKNSAWRKAAEVPELQMFFRPKAGGASALPPAAMSTGAIDPRMLRRVKILADLTDEQLGRFAGFMETEKIAPWKVVVKQGDCEDSMYLILEGEFRVRVSAGDRETILATLGAGEFFGDISLFDHGPRSADVVANTDGVLLKITSQGIRKLAADAPAVALPFLLAMGKTLAARIRSDNKRYFDSVKFNPRGGLVPAFPLASPGLLPLKRAFLARTWYKERQPYADSLPGQSFEGQTHSVVLLHPGVPGGAGAVFRPEPAPLAHVPGPERNHRHGLVHQHRPGRRRPRGTRTVAGYPVVSDALLRFELFRAGEKPGVCVDLFTQAG